MELMNQKNKHLLTRSSDRISFLYIEKARLEQSEYGVQVVQGNIKAEIPVTTVSCILLGPGTSITHRAVANIAKAGCSLCWVGECDSVFYAHGEPTTNKSKNVLAQIKAHENKAMHLEVVHRMYALRYPEERLKTKTVAELRGIEGKHVKESYESNALKYGIEWSGRKYKVDDFDSQDLVNQYITAINQMLYAVVESVIVAIGYSPAIGFIHTGHIRAFVYDIADLYKERYTIPLAFELANSMMFNRQLLVQKFRELLVSSKLLSSIAKNISNIFPNNDSVSIEAELELWGDKNFAKSGKNYSKG